MTKLSLELKDATAKAHQNIEKNTFAQNLLRCKVKRELYGEYLNGLLSIYTIMENNLARKRHHDILGHLYLPDLFRSRALKADLDFFCVDSIQTSYITKYINQAIKNSPEWLIALVYVRFMADLGGGQIIGAQLSQQWQLSTEPGSGLDLYSYSKPVSELRQLLRTSLDSLELTKEKKKTILSAAVEVFALHESWFNALNDKKHSNTLPLNILLVEDNDINARVSLIFLKKLGVKTTRAYNGQEALELWSRQKFDMVLMDLSMPVMDGYQSAKHMNATDAVGPSTGIPVVAMTAHMDQRTLTRCLDAGIKERLIKPFSLDDLSSTIQNNCPNFFHDK